MQGALLKPKKLGLAMSHTQEALVQSAQAHLYQNYRQPPLVFVRGDGAELWDASGKRYLDLFAGIAVSTLGHAHPRLVRAIAEQAGKLIHLSNYFYNEPNILLAEKLCALARMDRAFFCNSGTEAIEACLKLARRHFFAAGEVKRHRVIAFENSFHGRTLGALAATGQAKYREGFGPMGGVSHVPYGDMARVREAMGDDVAAILVEPIQGEGGVLPAPPGFLKELRALTTQTGSLLILDEVQTGVGRSGRFLACEHEDIRPDVVALAKALGGGVPIGAMLCTKAFEGALPAGTHGSTFGGNPLASAAALAVLDALTEDKLMERAAVLGQHLTRGLQAIAERHPKQVEQVRGRGLLQAMVLREGYEARQVLGPLKDVGVLLTAAGDRALRFSPPLVISEALLDEGMGKIEQVIGALA